ncbi:MAG: SCO family protein [Actinobacteria bacterium]|nr:SCO family protein [Actinomycetota bacterium]
MRFRSPVCCCLAAWALLAVPGCDAGRRVTIEKPDDDAPAPVAGRVEDGDEAGAFVLTDQTGAAFDSAALAGKVWVGSVFFANCPGPCFRENQALADLLRKIDHPDLVVVSLTCDPDNDTPEVLGRYAERFEADAARWKFLTGDMAVIKQIANGTFRLPAEVGVHSERGVVFDRQGKLRGGYHLLQPDRVEQLEALVREVLAEEAAATPATAEGPAP